MKPNHLRTFVERLHDAAEEANRQRQEKLKQSNAQPKPNELRPVKPLDVQITELMASLPPAQRNRKWSMAEFVSRLEGRYRDKPHPQMIGEALRRLGWSTVRDYSIAGGGRRYWLASMFTPTQFG